MYGYFTHGTDPPPRPYSSGFLSLPHCLRRLSSPTSIAVARSRGFRRASGTTQPSDYCQGIARHSLIGLLTPVPPGDPASPPEVPCCSSVPCRPQTPCYRGRMSDVFASYTQARPLHFWTGGQGPHNHCRSCSICGCTAAETGQVPVIVIAGKNCTVSPRSRVRASIWAFCLPWGMFLTTSYPLGIRAVVSVAAGAPEPVREGSEAGGSLLVRWPQILGLVG
jgi:hypothetical protein